MNGNRGPFAFVLPNLGCRSMEHADKHENLPAAPVWDDDE